jgi:hypothetical protein
MPLMPSVERRSTTNRRLVWNQPHASRRPSDAARIRARQALAHASLRGSPRGSATCARVPQQPSKPLSVGPRTQLAAHAHLEGAGHLQPAVDHPLGDAPAGRLRWPNEWELGEILSPFRMIGPPAM